MRNFSFYAPTYFDFGADMAKNTGALVRRFGGKKVLLHYGGGSIKRNGAYDAVTASLEKEGIPYVELPGVEPNPKSGLVYKGIELCRKEGVDFILAVGGGSVIDSSKAISAGVLYDGDFWDIFEKQLKIEKTIPVGVVLTIPAAGSEGSDGMVITNENGNLKWSGPASDLIRPKFSILDPKYTFTLPPYQTACGITDMMAHICERYFTNTPDVSVTDRLCEGLLMAIIENAPKVMANPQDYEARAAITWSGMLAHNNLCGTDRTQDWGSHDIEHELSALTDCAHGAGLAVIMPAWMEYVVDHDALRFKQFAVRVWGCKDEGDPRDVAMEGIKSFRKFLVSLGMPQTLGELNIEEKDIKTLVDHREKRGYPFGNFIKIQKEDMEGILKIALGK